MSAVMDRAVRDLHIHAHLAGRRHHMTELTPERMEHMATTLEGSGRYRVLRPLAARVLDAIHPNPARGLACSLILKPRAQRHEG